MKIKTLTSLIATSTLLSINVPATAFADDGFSGTGELGFSDNTGNTVNTSLYGALKLKYAKDNYAIESAFETNYKSENGSQTEERYIADIQGNRYYNSEKTYYSFVGIRLEKNRFENIELDTTLTAGLGKSLYKTEATLLKGEVGIGYQDTNYESTGTESESQTVGVAKLDFTHQINQQVAFTQDLSYKTGSDQTKIESNTGFKIKVGEKVNLKATYKYRNNSNPAAGAKKTDTQTLLTLTYDL